MGIGVTELIIVLIGGLFAVAAVVALMAFILMLARNLRNNGRGTGGTCPHCNAATPPAAKYCPACGASLSAPG